MFKYFIPFFIIFFFNLPAFATKECPISDKLIASAKKGNLQNQYQLGSQFKKCAKKEPKPNQWTEKSLFWYEKAARKNHKQAQYELALIFLYHNKHISNGVYWMTRSAQNGYIYAQYELGIGYRYKRFGLKEDLKKASELMKKSAMGGYSYAQYELAKMYAMGAGMPQDSKQAELWLKKAASQNHKKAQWYLDQFEKHKNNKIMKRILLERFKLDKR